MAASLIFRRLASTMRPAKDHLLVVRMPKLSPTMRSGKLRQWLRAPGQVVDTYSLLFELETDSLVQQANAVGKFAGTVTMQVESCDVSGYLLAAQLVGENGPELKTGQAIGVLCETEREVEWIQALGEEGLRSFVSEEFSAEEEDEDRSMCWQAFLKDSTSGGERVVGCT